MKKQATTTDAYISGIAALNIPCPDDTWGEGEFFLLLEDDELLADIAGDGPDTFVNTNDIFGSEGVYECSEILNSLAYNVEHNVKIYCANHYRAFCDLLMSHLIKSGESYLDPSDYFSTEAHLQVLEHWVARCEIHLPSNRQKALIKWRKNTQILHFSKASGQ